MKTHKNHLVMKNLKAVLITFLICIFTVNVCWADGLEAVSKFIIFSINCIVLLLIYLLNIGLLIRRIGYKWIIISSIIILGYLMRYSYNETNGFHEKYPVFILIILVIFLMHLINLIISIRRIIKPISNP